MVCKFHLVFIFMSCYFFSGVFDTTEALKCYICTNLKLNNTNTDLNCTNSVVSKELLKECVIPPINGTTTPKPETLTDLYIPGEIMDFIGHHNFPLSSVDVEDLGKWNFICMKISAEIGGDPYILRGCAIATPDTSNSCEKIEDGLKIGVKKGKVCFCDKEGCNGASKGTITYSLIITAAALYNTMLN